MQHGWHSATAHLLLLLLLLLLLRRRLHRRQVRPRRLARREGGTLLRRRLGRAVLLVQVREQTAQLAGVEVQHTR